MSTVVVKQRRAQAVEDAGANAIPAELVDKRDRVIRYQRDGAVYATDGKVGLLKRIVVDEGAGEVADLVVLVEASNRHVLIPPDLVDKTAGSAVFLTVNRTQFTERAATAPEYDKAQFTGADQKTLLAAGRGAQERSPRRAVAQMGRDYLETPAASPLDRLTRATT